MVVGSVDESDLFQSYITDKNTAERPIREVMGKPFPIVKLGTPVEEVSKLITKRKPSSFNRFRKRENIILLQNMIL